MMDKSVDHLGNAFKLNPLTHLELFGFEPMGSYVKCTHSFCNSVVNKRMTEALVIVKLISKDIINTESLYSTVY